jgi:hypothetical protein
MSAEPFGGSRDALIAGAQRRLGEPGAVLTVVGEPGIGKTTVWSRLLSSAAADWQWATRCLEVEADLGLAVLADFFSAVPDEVALAVPAPQRHARDVVLFRAEERGEGPVGSRLLGAALLGVLRELGGAGYRRPAVVRPGVVRGVQLCVASDRRFADRGGGDPARAGRAGFP